MNINSDRFEYRLKAIVSKVGSVAETARRVGVSEATVRKWRDGDTDPQRKNLIKLAESANFNLLWLATGAGEMMLNDNSASIAQVLQGSGIEQYYLQALELIEDVLQAKRANIRPSKKVELVKYVADMIEKENAEDVKNNVIQLVKMVS